MATVDQIILVFNRLQANLEQLINNTIEETKNSLTDDIKAQLYAGTDATGNKITPRYRNVRYAKKKAFLNPRPGLFTPDLKLTGALYKGLFALVYEENLLFSSNVDYAGLLEKKYGIKIFEPNRSNLNDYITGKFRPALFHKIEVQTGLSFQ
ncbi:MAG TPA: hypothetical protein VFW07_01350 [Parafilimonas sp.]|nr:hypothetical protein [Parafilimonas sp.]